MHPDTMNAFVVVVRVVNKVVVAVETTVLVVVLSCLKKASHCWKSLKAVRASTPSGLSMDGWMTSGTASTALDMAGNDVGSTLNCGRQTNAIYREIIQRFRA